MINELDDRAYLEPPDYENQAVFRCCYCECSFFEGDDYYDIQGKPYCEDCLNDNFRKTAEKYEFWED